MKNYLITWFYAENKEDESFYPSVGGNTSSREFQAVYWKCVYDFYESAQLLNGNRINYLFFTNVNDIPTDIDGVDIQDYFSRSHIEVINTELTTRTPKDWYGAWRNQFYVFDILSHLRDYCGNFLILDSDCLIRKPLLPIFEQIQDTKVVLYDCGFDPEHEVDGITIDQMRTLYKEFYGEEGSVTYKGGEWIGINSDVTENVIREYHKLWALNYEKYLKDQMKLNEEAHFLSLIFYKLGYSNSIANEYLRRMWTSLVHDNICKRDMDLAIWHLPAEKRYGFEKIFNWFRKKQRTKEEFVRYSGRVLAIPGFQITRKMKKYVHLAVGKLLR